eukprot:3185493-Pyramimonas_sp.AAC.1
MCSGSSSLRSISVRFRTRIQRGLNPQRSRAQSRHGTSQFSTAQHGTALGMVRRDRCTQHST